LSRLLTLDEGTLLAQFARQTIENYVIHQRILKLPETPSEALLEPRSVFVTIKKQLELDSNQFALRGCIGRLQSANDQEDKTTPLLLATQQAAISSAMEDPRFAPLKPSELDSVLIEVSVLTLPEEIIVKDRNRLHEQIAIGRDGLIIDSGTWRKGLLLPQVAPEQGWNSEDFLRGCCQKAGLPPKSYLDPKVKIYKFQAQIFAETSVRGSIIERKF
jgi:uncharacterized protein (TIGR00296 family)